MAELSGPDRMEGLLRAVVAGSVVVFLTIGWSFGDAPGAYAAAAGAAIFGVLLFLGQLGTHSWRRTAWFLLDSAVLGVLIWETGGEQSPLFPLYLLAAFALVRLVGDARNLPVEGAVSVAALIGGYLVAVLAGGGWALPGPAAVGLQAGLLLLACAVAVRAGVETREARRRLAEAEESAALEHDRATKTAAGSRVFGSALDALGVESAMGLVAEAARGMAGGSYAHVAALRGDLHRSTFVANDGDACPTWWHPSVQRLVLQSCREDGAVRHEGTVHGIAGFLAVPIGTEEEGDWGAIVVGGGPRGVGEELVLKDLAATVGPALRRPDDALGGVNCSSGLPNAASLFRAVGGELSSGKQLTVLAVGVRIEGEVLERENLAGFLGERLKRSNQRVFHYGESTLVVLSEVGDEQTAMDKARRVLRFIEEVDEHAGSRAAVGYVVANGQESDADALVGAAIRVLGEARDTDGRISGGNPSSGYGTNHLVSPLAPSVRGLFEAMVAHDGYLAEHSAGVSRLSRRIGRALSMSEEQIDVLVAGALLHDVGKIGISARILSKRDALNDEEYAAIKEHPSIGVTIASPFPELATTLPAIGQHHERYDGRGYPDGLRGEDIPLIARIVCAADAFDSMTRERPYRRPIPAEHALKVIQHNAGTQFDPQVARALSRAMPSSRRTDPDDPLTGFAV